MKFSWKHYAAIVLVLAAGVVKYLQGDLAADKLLHMTPEVLGAAAFILAMVSQSIFGTPTPPDPNTLASKKPPIGLAMLTMVLGLFVVGCKGANFPSLDGIEKIVVQDLSNGATDQQIGLDVCTFLGGTAQTDAVCANVGQLVADAITLLIDTGVLQGQAAARGKAYLVAHAATHAAADIDRDQRAAVEVLQAVSVSP